MMLKHNQTLENLRSINAKQGKLLWIGIRPAHREPLVSLDQAELLKGKGIKGDHIAKRNTKKRQITLIQAEHLIVVQKLLNHDDIKPETLRRNLLIEGLNLMSLKDRDFSIGDCILQGTGQCHPCSRMEEELGKGGYNAMRGHGGITAIVKKGGIIKPGYPVELLK